jgi:hypothetical protein
MMQPVIAEETIMSDLPPQVLQTLAQFTEATKAQTAATIAAAVVGAAGRPVSIQQVLDIARDVQFAIFPNPGSQTYVDWARTRDQRLGKVHGPTGN